MWALLDAFVHAHALCMCMLCGVLRGVLCVGLHLAWIRSRPAAAPRPQVLLSQDGAEEMEVVWAASPSERSHERGAGAGHSQVGGLRHAHA
jgi:hypothetical protein